MSHLRCAFCRLRTTATRDAEGLAQRADDAGPVTQPSWCVGGSAPVTSVPAGMPTLLPAGLEQRPSHDVQHCYNMHSVSF
jgi:hypothetical protein